MGYSGPEPLCVPAEFWDREDVRIALAARTMTDLFVLLRRWSGASQFRIALTTGLSQARVSRIMNGQQKVEKFELIERIADGLGMPDQARMRLGLAPRMVITAPPVRERTMPSALGEPLGRAGGEVLMLPGDPGVALDSMKRRTLMTWGVAAAAAATVAGVGGDARVVGRIGRSDVERLERDASRLYTLDYEHGGNMLWHAADALVTDAHGMLGQGARTGNTERELLSAAGRVHMCAGWLAFDAGQLEVARHFYNEALSLAHQNNDPDLAANALANLAFRSNIVGRPQEGYRFAEASSRVAAEAHGHPRLSVIPYLRLATANSLSGDQSGSNNAIRLARLALDRDSDVPARAWYSFVSHAEIDGVEGTCAAALGQPQRAEALLENAIQAHSDQYSRNRALYRVRLASARLDHGAVDGAAEAANQALDDLSGQVGSWRVQTELDDVASRLKAAPRVGGVASFLDRHSLAA